VWAIARLQPGVPVDQARAEMRTIGARVAAAFPATNAAFSFRASELARQYFVDARNPLWYLLGGSVFVLLIGCANVANLLLVRSSDRAREFAVRQALGASGRQLARQMMVESAVLAAVGAVAGLTVAFWLTPALVAFSGISLPAYASVGIDGTVLMFTIATAIACGLLFGLAPMWRAARANVRDAIGSIRVARPSRAARWLAGVEITAAFVLAAGALLILQSFSALTNTTLLFRSDRLLTARFELPSDRYPTPAARVRAGDQLLERVRSLPGVEHATLWGPSMFGRSTWVAFLSPADRVIADNERLMVWRHSTNPGALHDLGIRMISGRDIAPSDTLDTAPVAVISEATARTLWPGLDPIGRLLRVGTSPVAVSVVGVAADARHRGRFRFSQGANAYESQLDIYFPYAQRPNALITIGLRTHGAPEHFTRSLRAALAAFDPGIAAYDIATLDERMRDEEQPVAFATVLLNAYGVLAILLAAIGVYGVLAAAVAGRTRELGIRTALGADPRRLVGAVVWEGLTVSVIAVAIGALAAWALARSFGSLLFGVADHTPITLVAAAAILITIAGAASMIPARRASRVDPVSALRND
jgi:predicted permease